MNRTRKSLEMNKTIGIGSWPRFTSEFWRCPLPMNRPPHPVPLPLRGGEGARRAGEGDGSSSQRVRKSERRLPMSSAETTRTNGESSIAWNGFTIQRSNVSTLLIAWPQGTSGEEVSSDWREFHEAPLPIPRRGERGSTSWRGG